MPSDSGKPRQCMGGDPPPSTEPLPCPRCDSTKTKFCYYNNYNLSQPRHFCKSCRRYWTQGGTLRDVPVGGGSRKNSKRSRPSSSPPDTSSSSSSSSSSTTTAIEHLPEKPMSALAGVNLDSTYNHLNLFETMDNGPRSFTSLLNFQNSGLLSLAGFDEMSYGFGKGAWSYPGVSDDVVGGYGGIREWHLNVREVGEEVEDDCAWPELAIATQRKSFK